MVPHSLEYHQESLLPLGRSSQPLATVAVPRAATIALTSRVSTSVPPDATDAPVTAPVLLVDGREL